jgi:hypothetical protein
MINTTVDSYRAEERQREKGATMKIEEYEPFGKEWEKEMMRLRKKDLIALFKMTCLENQEFKKEVTRLRYERD